jgi:hypothetical protein
MKISSSARKIRLILEKAIGDHQITREDYDIIMHLATEDANIDPQEKVLLQHLHEMLEDKSIKFVKNYGKDTIH